MRAIVDYWIRIVDVTSVIETDTRTQESVGYPSWGAEEHFDAPILEAGVFIAVGSGE
jgi:hypothetical protein